MAVIWMREWRRRKVCVDTDGEGRERKAGRDRESETGDTNEGDKGGKIDKNRI